MMHLQFLASPIVVKMQNISFSFNCFKYTKILANIKRKKIKLFMTNYWTKKLSAM